MLRQLHIANLAVIQDAAIEFGPGLNCFTGQTGAGKSLVLGALEILLCLRSGGLTDMIRPGAEEARVSGVFEFHDPALARDVAAAADLALPPDEPLLLNRRLFASGRSTLTINGQPATAGMVRAIAEQLVDIHGQHEHQFLLKTANQLLILDGFAEAAELRRRFAEHYARLRDLRQRQNELHASQTLRRQQFELFEFQAREIDAAGPRAAEYPELKARHAVLTNLAKLKREAGAAHAALHENEQSILERLHMAAHVLGELALIDAQLGSIAEQTRGAAASLQDTAYELQRYVERLEIDAGEITEVADRLNTLNRLIAKYADHAPPTADTPAPAAADPVARVLAYRGHIEEQMRLLRQQHEDTTRVERDIAAAARGLAEVGAELSKLRRGAAARLKPLVDEQLRELGMPEAQFEIEFGGVAAADGEGGQPSSPTGLDTVEMLVRTNPGQPARPLRRIASGGELSRVMLALKAILAQADRISVLVFDEVDANVGGRMGTVIGMKLRALARPRGGARKRSDAPGQQILCITHLPQIAAFADRHFRIAKAVVGQGPRRQTVTSVQALEGPARIEELAEMLAGKDASETTRRQARELLATARA